MPTGYLTLYKSCAGSEPMLNILSVIMERTQICVIHVWMLNAFVLLCSSCVRCQYEGDIRLVDGPTSNEGRVEIYHSGLWGTVCDEGWDNNDASVVCRQLGYSSVGAVARLHAYYGEGSDPIHLVDVNCTGYETTLNYCSSTRLDRWGIEKCEHYKDAGVSCREHEGDIRLVGSSTSYEGRVEIYYSGQWGTVCDDSWDNTDASVVCRQLGYSSGNTTHRYYGRGSGPIHLDGVNCTGNESRLTSCGSSEWGVENCAFYDVARVSCSYDYAEGTIRLVDGSTPNQGRVEIFHNGQWGTVCDDGWNEDEASVVCRQLGYTGPYAYARSNAYYGQGSGPIHLDEVSCFGYGFESRLTQCSHEPWGINDCDHGDDAGVHCGYVPTTVAPQPTVSSKVVGMMSFVGVSLFLLTLAAIGAVCYTCYPSKPAVRTSPSEQFPLSNIANNTPAAPTTSGITYPSDPTQPSIPPPSQLPANAYPPPAESAPPSAPPAYKSLEIAHP